MRFSISFSFILAFSFVSVVFGSSFKAFSMEDLDDYSGHCDPALLIEMVYDRAVEKLVNGIPVRVTSQLPETDAALQYHGYASRLYMARQESSSLGHNEPLKRLAEYECGLSDRNDIKH